MTGRAGSADDDRLFDPGLQPERTDLAWRRTTLAVAVGALLALRVLPPVLGGWSAALPLAGLLVTVVLWALADRRARQTREALLRHAPPPAGGALMLLLAVTTAVGAFLGVLVVTLR